MATDTTAKEHLLWSKERARAYLDAGEPPVQAFSSMISDLRNHPDTADHPGITLGFMLAMSGSMQTPGEVRAFVDGFN